MNIFHLNKRNLRPLFLLIAVVLVVYVPFTLLQTVLLTSRERPPSKPAGHDKQGVSVEIRDVVADEDGNVRLVLNLNMKDLLQMLDQDALKTKEATANAPPMNVTITRNVPDLCDKVPDLKYVIYVHTSPGNLEKRNLLRNTWASPRLFKTQITQLVFFMGQPSETTLQAAVQDEAAKYGDIIQGSFTDNYKNLTLKGVMALHWLAMHCKKADFAIKADDDAFVNIFRLMDVLSKQDPTHRILACPMWHDNSMPILRDPAKCAKWCVKYNEFVGRKFFPQYCAGLSFTLSRSMIPEMYKAAHATPFFWIDDVYITGLLPPKVKDVEYVSLIRNFTVKQPVALAQYNNTKSDMSFVYVHGKKADITVEMWKWTLARMEPDLLATLSDEFKEKAQNFRETLGLNIPAKSARRL